MAEPPKLTDAEATVMRRMNMNLVEWHSALDSLHTRGLRKASGATPIGLAALAAYDAEQRRAIRVEAMHECILAATAVKAAAEADGDEDDDVFDLAQERAYGAKLVLRAIADLIAKEESNG